MHVTSKVCMGKDVGLNGNLFGGNMLAWIDESAYIFADGITNGRYFLVTKKFGEIVFEKPVKEGDIVHFNCGNVSVGNTSISFNISAVVNRDTVFSTSVVFVAIDENGKKTEINKDMVNTVE